MSTEHTAPQAAELPPQLQTILDQRIAEEQRITDFHNQMNALDALDPAALPAWALRFLLGAGDGRTRVSLERYGERHDRDVLDEFVIRAERGRWHLELNLSQSYVCLDCNHHHEDMADRWRESLTDLAELLADPRVAALYRETPRQRAAALLLSFLERADAEERIAADLQRRGETVEQPAAE